MVLIHNISADLHEPWLPLMEDKSSLSYAPHHSKDILKQPSRRERRGIDNKRRNNEFEK